MKHAVLTCLCLSALCSANVITVPDDYGSIQAAVDAAVDSDTVIVRPGNYDAFTFGGKQIVVQSQNPTDAAIVANTIIQPAPLTRPGRRGSSSTPSRRSAVLFQDNETPASVLRGFTIMGGGGTAYELMDSSYVGSGIAIIEASPTIEYNVIQSPFEVSPSDFTTILFGGGIGCINSQAIIIANTITSCSGVYGGGICCWGGDVKLANNLIVENTAFFGTGVFLTSGQLLNNTIARNFTSYNGDDIGGSLAIMFMTGGSHCIVRNNIICESRGGSGVLFNIPSSYVDFAYNNIWGNTPQDYLITANDASLMRILPTPSLHPPKTAAIVSN